jgi:hypothetical protein
MENHLSAWILAATCVVAIALQAQERPPTAKAPRQQAAVPSECNTLEGGRTFARTELFFGRAKADGSIVTDEEFRVFLDDIVTPRFPNGWTALSGAGQFRASTGMIQREGSVFVILLYPTGDRNSSEHIEEIREGYKNAFAQESVLRVDSASCVDF